MADGYDGLYILRNDLVTEVEQLNDNIPNGFELSQNYPNPFNPSTSIRYAVGSKQFVVLKVYDVLGNEVATLVNEESAAGNYEVEFDALNHASGIYIYSLKSGSFSSSKKMILMR